ncbi:unnamed protein product [Symbiodinium sp. CCMP2592]|nr:unnamed protein product [Symbiodinium sp. CCMP2592]
MPLDITRVGRKSYVTTRGLAEVLEAVKKHGLPSTTSRSDIKRKRSARANVMTPYGHVIQQWRLQTEDGGTVAIDYCHPAALVWHLCSSSEPLQNLLLERMGLEPCSLAAPWRVVFYSDEITPGNQLRSRNPRKLQAIYFSFANLGSAALGKEKSWFLLCAVRSKTVQSLQSGMGQLCRAAMLSFRTHGADLSSGIQLYCGESRPVLCAQLGILLSDESALKYMANNKGASGKLPCVLCRNVIHRRYKPEKMREPLVTHTDINYDHFILHTQKSLAETAEYLETQSRTLNKGAMQDLQTKLGFNHAPLGILASSGYLEMLYGMVRT